MSACDKIDEVILSGCQHLWYGCLGHIFLASHHVERGVEVHRNCAAWPVYRALRYLPARVRLIADCLHDGFDLGLEELEDFLALWVWNRGVLSFCNYLRDKVVGALDYANDSKATSLISDFHLELEMLLNEGLQILPSRVPAVSFVVQ